MNYSDLKQFVFKILTLIIIIVFATYWIGLLLDNYLISVNSNKLLWTLNKKQEHYDDAFLGSSRTLMMVDINEWEKLSGHKAINIGLDGSGMADHYLTMVKFIQNGNRIKKLFLQIDHATLSNTFTYPFRDYIWALFRDEPFIEQIKEEVDAFRYASLVTHPFLKFIVDNRKYSFTEDVYPFSSTKGSFFNDTVVVNDVFKSKSNKDLVKNDFISATFTRNFDRILTLCKKEQIELILYTVPIHPKIGEHLRYFVVHTVDSIATFNQLTYIDLTKYTFQNDSIYYRQIHYKDGHIVLDYGHTNSVGTKMITSELWNSYQAILQLN